MRHLKPLLVLGVLLAAATALAADAPSLPAQEKPCYSRTFSTPAAEGFLSLKGRHDARIFGAGSVGAVGGASDVMVSLFNHSGKVNWTMTFGGADNDFARGVWNTSDGGAIVGAAARGLWGEAWEPSFWLLKLDANGALEWERGYWFGGGHGTLMSVQATHDNNVPTGYILGGIQPGFAEDGWIARIGLDGEVLWAVHVGQSNTPVLDNYDEIWRVVQTPRSGGFIATGWAHTNHGDASRTDMSAIVLKLRANGTVEWFKMLGAVNKDEQLRWIKEMERPVPGVPGAKEVVYAATGSAVTGADRTKDLYAVLLDRQGGIVWQTSLRTAYGTDEMGHHIHHVDVKGKGHALVISGNSRSDDTPHSNGFVAALDETNGALLWAKEYYGADDHLRPTKDTLTVVEPALPTHDHVDPRLMAAGYTYNTGGGEGDAWVVAFPYDGAPALGPLSPIQVRNLTLVPPPGAQLPPATYDAAVEHVYATPFAPRIVKPLSTVAGYHAAPLTLATTTHGTC